MSFHLYNTLSRSLEAFKPAEDGHVRLYTCGPTVYNYAHIGNFRAYIFEDLLRRHLQYCGYRVTQVMNLTDVDDKTIRSATEKGMSLKDYTAPFITSFFEDLKLLNIEPAAHYPAATDHIPEMIHLIEVLLEKGNAYQAEDGSVYFRINSFSDYGKLAHLDMEGLQAGARVDQDEYEKDTAADFALWKAWSERDGDIWWDSPWGRGRPGWHIECSAMSMKFLGESFDLHTGGVDNMFPHHEDEIAQSEAATGKPFVRYWMHCAHLVVDGKKMSKSLGNFYTLRDLVEKGFTGREIRYVLIGAHYRQSLNFSMEALQSARSALQRLDEFTARLQPFASKESGELPSWAAACEAKFRVGMDQDLNISEARAALFDLVHEGNRKLDAGGLSASEGAAVHGLMQELDRVFGFLAPDQCEVPTEAEELMNLRQKAREDKDWSEADRLRDALAGLGWEVQDTADGPKLKRRQGH